MLASRSAIRPNVDRMRDDSLDRVIFRWSLSIARQVGRRSTSRWTVRSFRSTSPVTWAGEGSPAGPDRKAGRHMIPKPSVLSEGHRRTASAIASAARAQTVPCCVAPISPHQGGPEKWAWRKTPTWDGPQDARSTSGESTSVASRLSRRSVIAVAPRLSVRIVKTSGFEIQVLTEVIRRPAVTTT